MKLWILIILGFTIAGMLKDLVYILAGKFWKHALVPIWQIAGPKPGGKIWAAVQAVKGN